MPSLFPLLRYLPQVTAIFFLVGFLLTAAFRWPTPLRQVITKGFSASTIPSGIVLVGCAFNPSLLQYLAEINLYISFAGAVVIWTALAELFGKPNGV